MKNSKKEILDVKIGTKEEAKWEKIKKRAEEMLEQTEIEIEINKAVLDLAEKKIEKEKCK